MKKMTILAVILALAVALTACGSEQAQEPTAAATDAPAASTAAPAEAVASQPLTLTDWSMHASTWSSPNGATIHISATPNSYAEGQTAAFVVRLEDAEIANVPCEWDGAAYTAAADLNAANGYCYYVILTAADGTSSEVAVNTPAAPTNEIFIDMEASLESYCSIIVEDSSVESNKLTLVSGQVEVKVPLLTNEGEAVTCQEAALVLSLNGEELSRKTVTLTQTDASNVYAATLENLVFEIPTLENDQAVDLSLNAALTNGQVLTAFGGNWFYSEEGLLPVVG